MLYADTPLRLPPLLRLHLRHIDDYFAIDMSAGARVLELARVMRHAAPMRAPLRRGNAASSGAYGATRWHARVMHIQIPHMRCDATIHMLRRAMLR